jgi:phosphoglycerate dehydrogenase-like enzyme
MSGLLKPEALFINVGRGDLISSDSLLKALSTGPSKLFGVGIDVTDPEPLPDGHPLFIHPRVLLTPHVSGDTEGEFGIVCDILIENVKRLREGRELINEVNLERGY